ncbi:RagB/SusD family nutrient uptake outer membrane protein [Dyadobacter sediminis]|uniref:RagB/SusD family nutrient uptake outer membrane protein n=1 Tax=Dyadobacter sediminis TaxID=1493691 RepID=A0A5R9K8Z7_9BACT|nr:RagB/SusD family nutrient uptake outer membrane protein [Dyadobacter sediminis]TLU90521.1 RagB/SusD family nutrient uptake outer membrane protein [Dyadobacter sediminis]GGC08390.1 membrane protein [Dyadobacter sediminis]
MKNINFKNNLKKAGVCAGLISMLMIPSACRQEFLDTDPQGKQAGTVFWTNEADATKAVNAMYANLRSWRNTAFASIAVESMGSDDTEKGSTPSDATFFNDYDRFTVGSSDGQLADFWSGQYQNINYANQVITNIPAISMDEALKARYIGEAKFIRAYSYFRLVRAYGDVPLRLTLPKDATEYNIPRSPKAEVYAAIEADLTDAAAVLPLKYGSTDTGRATKGAAMSLHAKVAMYQQKWQQVFDLTNQVMTSGQYSLFPNFEALFRVQNENSAESIFEIQNELIPSNKDASNSQYSQVQGVRGVVGGGWGFNTPTEALVDSFETGDPRMDASIIFRGETTPAGDVIPKEGDNPMYNQKSYVPFNLYITGFNEGSQQNIRVIRYAEVLLMNAEAANELGNTTQALASLEMVRARARGTSKTVLPKITTTDKAALRLAIWHERHVELALEYDRYFDVIRQGRAAQIFGPLGWKPNKNEVWPIPQSEIDLSGGTLTQNPGY